MKYLLTLLIRFVDRIVYAMWTWLSPRSSVFYVRGRFLYDSNRERVILRGINLMLLDDWDFPGIPGSDLATTGKLDELAKTGANAVRIQWYANYPKLRTFPHDISHLDAFLDKCRENSLIPIVELHDWTCKDFTEPDNMQIDRLTELIDWWTRPDVVAVLRRHERYLIINLANELGRYRFKSQAQQATALNDFRDAYKTAITSIRDEGLRMPIMIDAPDCGQSINAFTIIGRELIRHDRRRSLLLSVHSYWAGYDGRPEIDAAYLANLPIVFGEIANKQDEGDSLLGNIPGYYALDGTGQNLFREMTTRQTFWSVRPAIPVNQALFRAVVARIANNPPPTGFRYQDLLKYHLMPLDIGWLAWAWHKDICEARQMTPDGNYANLTMYGDDIVNNPDYGLKFWAEKTNSLPGAPPPP